jgi:hypothetical protein
MGEHQYRFERINESHYPDMCFISRSAFNIDPGVSFYQKKNKTEKFGEVNLGFIAYSETGDPAAFYGVYAHLVEYNGKVYHAVQSGDTMTHKDHGGKGLFTQLAKLTYELAKQSGAEFVFGSPNYNSYPGFVKKLDWVCPEKFRDYRIRIFTLPLAKIAKKIPALRTAYQSYFNFICGIHKSAKKSFKNSVLADDILGVHRNEDFYKYKSLAGSKIVSIGKVNVWLKPDGHLFIGDIDLENEFDFEKFIISLKRFCFWSGCSEVAFLTSPDTRLDVMFAKYFKAKEGFPIGGADFTHRLPIRNFKMVLGDVDTF